TCLLVLGASETARALPPPPRPMMWPHVPARVPANAPVLITVEQVEGPVSGSVAARLGLSVDGRTQFDETVDLFTKPPDVPVSLLSLAGPPLAPGLHTLTFFSSGAPGPQSIKFTVVDPVPLP